MELEEANRFWPKERVETLTRIIYQIFEENLRSEQFRDYTPIDDAHKILLIKKILEKRALQPDGLTYFPPLLSKSKQETDFPGIYRSISNFFSLLVRNNFQDRFVENLAGRIIRLEEESPGTGEERYALESDLTWLFGDFEEIKREIKGYDNEDILASVRTYLKNGGRTHILAGTDVLILDGFVHVSRIEEDILFCFCRQVQEVWWLLDYDGKAKDPIGEFKHAVGREARFRKVDNGLREGEQLGRYEAYRIFTPFVSLMQRLEVAGFISSVERAPEGTFRNAVAGSLYLHGLVEAASNEGLRIRSFASRVDEVRAIAREIKKIVHEDKLDESRDLGKIRVIFPDLNDYSSLISEIFTAHGLPFSLTKGLSLSSHPTANIFRYIFKIPLNHFKREDIFRLFSSPLIQGALGSLPPSDGWLSKLKEDVLFAGKELPEVAKVVQSEFGKCAESELDIFLFDEVARKCGLSNLGADFSDLQEKGLLRVRDYYRDRFLRVKVASERENLLPEYCRFLAQMDLLERMLIPFRELAHQSNPQGIVEGFFRILDLMGFPENILNIPEKGLGLEPGRITAMLRRDMKAYILLKDLLQACATEAGLARKLFRINDGYPLLSVFYSIFKSRLSNTYLLDERNPNVLRVSEWLEIRGRCFDYVFAGGLTAESFPFREQKSFILPEALNKAFRIRAPVDESKYLFSHLLRNYRNRLYLSFPTYADGKEVQPSSMLLDLESMVQSYLAPEPGSRGLEEVFTWEENPYFASAEELLDAMRMENQIPEGDADHFFPVEQIIAKHKSLADTLIRAVDLLRSRWAKDGLFKYDGLVGQAAGFREFLMAKSDLFSPSQLETLANCPMRYLFEHIYGLKTLEELGPEVSHRDMGEHIHAILSVFFERINYEKKNVAALGIKRAFSLAMEVADAYFSDHPFLNTLEFFEFQKMEFLAGLDRNRFDVRDRSKEREGLFAQLLRFEEREFRDTLPAGVEYGFGKEGEGPVLLGKAKIRGYIDRFDIGGSNGEKVYLYDYKTGRFPTSDMVKKGLSFQLPAYIRALKTCLQFKEISAAFYALNREVFLKENPLRQRINDHCEGVQGLDISGVRLVDEYADDLLKLIEEGYFHHSADGLRCSFCEFKYACYKDMRRMDHFVHSGGHHQIYSGKENLEKWKGVEEFREKWKTVSLSMQQAFNLKTEKGRRRHLQSVMEYRDWLRENADSFPFYKAYIHGLLQKIGDFEKAYLSL